MYDSSKEKRFLIIIAERIFQSLLCSAQLFFWEWFAISRRERSWEKGICHSQKKFAIPDRHFRPQSRSDSFDIVCTDELCIHCLHLMQVSCFRAFSLVNSKFKIKELIENKLQITKNKKYLIKLIRTLQTISLREESKYAV